MVYHHHYLSLQNGELYVAGGAATSSFSAPRGHSAKQQFSVLQYTNTVFGGGFVGTGQLWYKEDIRGPSLGLNPD